MTTPVARASRVTNGPNTHRSLTTHPKPQGSSKVVVYAALAANLLVSATKFIAASVSGSASMMSEGVHSLVDTLNEVLLLYGMHRSSAVEFHFTRELYASLRRGRSRTRRSFTSSLDFQRFSKAIHGGFPSKRSARSREG